MKIAVAGAGYVGLSLAVLLSQKYEVIAYDLDVTKIDKINDRISPIEDCEISSFFENKNLNLFATNDKNIAYSDAKFIIIATPTNFDVENNYFDTKSIEYVVADVQKLNPAATVIIKSTIPIGFMRGVKAKFPQMKLIFSPEFLREGKALYDNLYPSRIVIGDKSDDAVLFSEMLVNCAIKKDIEVIFTNDMEAESIKLFANTYLAMRVAFFNELDNYCLHNQLNSADIINGLSLDSRIGNYYNNPSFGYGGYCLPKDTKQLLVNYKEIPQSLIGAIVDSNQIRKNFIAEEVLKLKPQKVGIYRLVMKHDSDNFRDAAILDIMKILKAKNIECIVYEPNLTNNQMIDIFALENNLVVFKEKSDVILTNRLNNELNDVLGKVFTRDIYTRD